MPEDIPFTYFLADEETPVTEDRSIWNNPLPVNRPHQIFVKDSPVSYGNYFSAVRSFLEKNSFTILLTAVSDHCRQQTNLKNVEGIQVFLEKHGEFYHPSRIRVTACGRAYQFVLNVAVTDTGKEYIKQEYRILKKLNNDFPGQHIPCVYGEGAVIINGSRICVFLGEWFDRYNEFHITRDPKGNQKTIVWDPVDGNYYLTREQTVALFRQAATILTHYYNTETFEQISQWHHAAGDFIIKRNNNEIDVRLITVRQYNPLFKKEDSENSEPHPQSILEALVVFFLNLSIRMRLDRMDGTGEIVWAETPAVYGIVSGFLKGLASKPSIKTLSIPLDDCFLYFLVSSYTEYELRNLAADIVNTYHPGAPEIPEIKKHLGNHVGVLYQAIHQSI